jgi:hypothetical protein
MVIQLTTERVTIQREPHRRPYGSRVDIVLGNSDRFAFDAEASLLVSNNCIVRLRPGTGTIGGDKVQKITAMIEGFATAGEAEQAGLKFSMSMLWLAISMACPLRLEYHTPLPCAVYDRTQRRGLTARGDAHLLRTSSAAKVVELIDQVFGSDFEVDRQLLLSMELFAAARLEITERARFIGLVSALEPLARQETLETPVPELVHTFLEQLDATEGSSDSVRRSLEGRIRGLGRESIAQAIARLVMAQLPDDADALAVVKDAYSIRSTILHDGSTDADLDTKGRRVEAVIRRIYAAILGFELRAAA